MNNLSILLYLADVSSSLATLLTVLGILGSAAGLVFWLMSLDKSPELDPIRPYRNTLFYALPIVALSCLFPSKDTMYAIAASEMGEEVLNSGIGTRATKALEAWLDKQIEEQTKEPTSE